ncbi:MAG: dihydropteroate synthase [Actinomycetota bacterium]
MKLRCRDHVLPLDRTLIMGVLNVTPDSFSDGGLYFEPAAAVERGLEMVEEGADIIDVGGESTRPGAVDVPEEEELRRVIPVLRGLAGAGVPLSIDTRKAEVARSGLEAGAAILNDTLGEETQRGTDEMAAESGAAMVVMHSRGSPATMRSLTDYDDVVLHVRVFLKERGQELERVGVAPESIVLDPGIGFAKTPAQNLELLRRLGELVDVGRPILVGTSRKSFIGQVLDLPEDQRVEGTLASVCWAVAKGARIVRVHDVKETKRAVRLTEAIAAAGIHE